MRRLSKLLMPLLLIGLMGTLGCGHKKPSGENASTTNRLQLPEGVRPTHYRWTKETGELRFRESVTFSAKENPDNDMEGFYWEVPPLVKTIIIDSGVQVTGGFRFTASATLKGEDRSSSEIFGTDQKNWALGPDRETHPQTTCKDGPKGDDLIDDCDKWRYGAVSATGDKVTVHINNLTVTNARTYAITSFQPRLVIDRVHIRNTRPAPDYHSNSDGISAGPNSVVTNSKIDVWDDAIKLYRDITVKNVTIIHNANGAPFQLGWGNGVPNSTHRLENILVKDHADDFNLALISASAEDGTFTRNISISGIKAIYEGENDFRSGKTLPLLYFKGPVALNLFFEDAPIWLSGDTWQLGQADVNVTFEDKKVQISPTIKSGNMDEITGCGW